MFCESGFTDPLKSPTEVFTSSWKVLRCVCVAELPVRIRGYAPGGVLAAVVITIDDVPDPARIVDGVSVAAVPLGSPLTLNATSPVKPSTGSIVTVYVAFPPTNAELTDGAIEPVKSAAVATSKPRGVVCDRLPLVPVSIRVLLVGASVLPDVMVSTDAPEPPLTILGLKLAVAPDGTPVTLRVTLPVNPLMGII